MKTNFTKRLLDASRQVLLACAMISAIGISDAAAQTCTVESNTTLDPATCTAVIMASDLATGGEGLVFHSVSLNGVAIALSPASAAPIAVAGASVMVTAPGTYKYQITDASGCWGTFNVEDKSGPVCTVGIPTGSTDTLGTRTIECNAANWQVALDILVAANFKDCSEDIERVYFVDQSVSGCGIVNPDTLGTPNQGAFVVPVDTEICAVYKRTWYAVDGDGNVSADNCSQYVFSLRSTAKPTIPTLVSVDCAASAQTVTDMMRPTIPSVITAGVTISLTNGTKVCKYIATVNEGDKLPTCGDGYKQINHWTVIDWCAGAIVADTLQLVVVEDITVPTTTAKGSVAWAANPFDCSGTITVGAAKGDDNCTTSLDWITSVRTSGTAGYGSSAPIQASENANGITVTDIAIGDSVFVSWIAVDACGNQSVALLDTFTKTEDNRGPVAICNDELNVSLVAANNTQQARVYAEDLDDTSRDNCGITNKEVSLDGVTYTDYVTLGCGDLGETTVYLKVYDAANNSNVCWTTITVEDKSVPVVTPPADLTINCLEEIPAVDTPTIVVQGCVAPTIVYDGQTNVGISCGVDVITRTWTVTPPVGSATHSSEPAPYTLTQKINVTPAPADWKATFPADVLTLTCGDDIPARLTLADIMVDNSCNDWLLDDVEDQEFSSGGDVCKKVIRTYTLINWCTVGNAGKAAAIVTASMVEEDDASGFSSTLQEYGKFTYTQVFKINDGDAPTADIAATVACDDNAADCNGGSVSVTVSNVADNCGIATVSSIVLTGNGATVTSTTASTGAASFTGLATGSYTATATITDDCGNQTVKSTTVEVKGDCKSPSPIGVMLFAPVMENCQVDVWLSDFQTSLSDNCSDVANIESAIELLTDVNTDGVIDREDANRALFTNPATNYDDYQSVTVTSVGGNVVALWARDEAGNAAFALVIVDAQDNDPNSGCSNTGGGAAAAVAGNITNENDEDIEQVMVKFESSSKSIFEQMFSGDFSYSVPMHTDLTITPEKDAGYMNGVTTADLVKLQRHILGISSLSSAYQIIAADVNSDEKVNTKDMLHISRLILGLYDELPNSSSWKFVSKDHQFSNPSSPWGFPQAIDYADLESDIQADFVGIKMGDLTGNASPSKLLGTDNTTVGEMTIAMDETTLTPGQATVVEFKAADFNDFAGFQFTISLGENVKLAQVTPGVLPNMSEDANFGLNRLDQGTITTSWSNANGVTLEDGDVLFSLTLESTETVNLSEVISINSKQTAAEAYNNDLDVHSVGVQFNRTEAASFQLFQNQPNPFNGETMIGFNMPKAGVATLKVMNVAGQVLTTQSAEFVRGYNQISLSKSELNTSGVLYYQIDTENHSATKKMVILE